MSTSKIEWTEATWNPATGCSKVSAGCANCYAERMAKRLNAMGQPNYAAGFNVTCHEHTLNIPLKWHKGRMIFVNSMSDLFHEEIEEAFIIKVFEVMNRASQHTFQVLTKRADRLAAMAPKLHWTKNIWIGVSVENQKYTSRVDRLRETDAQTKFLSMEPLLGPTSNLDLTGINWVIVGGESGPGARPMKEEWVLEIKSKCEASNVPFFFKQWGGVNKKRAGRTLQGKTWDSLPVAV
jgi:protein gp37